jgi:hypothetical protein
VFNTFFKKEKNKTKTCLKAGSPQSIHSPEEGTWEWLGKIPSCHLRKGTEVGF